MRTSIVSDVWVVVACAAYAAAAWLLQMYRVAAPRDWLRRRIKDLQTRIDSEHWRAPNAAKG